jgi:omega-hydroxy-beta-dihydromenaquinone-9 sulfotransferase
MANGPQHLLDNTSSGKKIYIVGNSRSGTTMMGRILGNHPDICGIHEVHFFEQLWTVTDKHQTLSSNAALSLAARLIGKRREGYFTRIDPDKYIVEARECLNSVDEPMTPDKVYDAFLRYETALKGKRIPCEQTPQNVFYIGEILDLFPGARFINMIRDPRDVLLSQKWKWKRRFLGAKNIPFWEAFRSWINYHPLTISKLWNASLAAADKYAGDGRVLSLRFEDLLQDPEKEIRAVCEFVGVFFDENLLLVPQIGSSSGTDNTVKMGINGEKTGNWRSGGLNPAEIAIVQKVSAAFMNKYHYEAAVTGVSPITFSYYMLSFPVKIMLALLFNIRRMKNLKDTIRRRLSKGNP